MTSNNMGTIFVGNWFIYLEPIDRHHSSMPEIQKLMIKYIHSYLGDLDIASWSHDEDFSAIKIKITRNNHDQNIGKLIRNLKTSIVKHIKRHQPDVFQEISPIFHTGYIATTNSNWLKTVKEQKPS